MNLNATIVVQALNFFITFWIVRFLLIKPVMTALSADQKVINDLQDSIEGSKQHIACTMVQRDRMWDSAREVFVHEAPTPLKTSEIVFKNLTPSLEYLELSEQGKSNFIAQSAQKIVQRLERCSE